MYTESRKIQLIEDVLKTDSETVLRKLESVLKKSEIKMQSGKNSFSDFVGILNSKDAASMKKIIEDGCERIDENDWK